MPQSFPSWLNELFRKADRAAKPVRRRSNVRRLQCELLEDRVVPAITILNAFNGGSLDADILDDGTVTIGGGTLSRGAVETASGNFTNITITSDGDIVFEDLSSTLVLANGGTFSLLANTGSVSFDDVSNSVTLADGVFQIVASGDIDLAGLDVGAGSIALQADGNITVNSSLLAGDFGIVLNADFDSDGDGGITTLAGGTVLTTGQVTILGASVTLGDTIDADTVEVRSSASGIAFGADDLLISSGNIPEAEPNNTLAMAQVLGAIDTRVDIFGTGDGTYDYYSFFAEAGTTMEFETTTGNFDTELFLFDSGRGLLAENDDFNVLLSFIQFTFATSDTYVIGVARFNSTGGTGGISGATIDAGQVYTLTITSDAVVAPAVAISQFELDLITANFLRFDAAAGNIRLESYMVTGVDTLELAAAEIIDGTGGEQADLAVENLVLRATAVGAGDEIDVAVSQLAGTAANGQFRVANTGDLDIAEITTASGTVTGVDAGTGLINISSNFGIFVLSEVRGGSVTLSTIDAATAGQDIVVDTGVRITATNLLRLNAGDNITVNGELRVTTPVAYQLTIDAGNADPAVGGTINLTNARFIDIRDITLTGGNASDTFIFRADISEYAVNGGGGLDTVLIDLLNDVNPSLLVTAPGGGVFSFGSYTDITLTSVENLAPSIPFALKLDLAVLGLQDGNASPNVLDLASTAGGVLAARIQSNSAGVFTTVFGTPATNISDITINGSSDRDTFRIDETNPGIPDIVLVGSGPNFAPGDTLDIDFTNITGQTLTPAGIGGGSFTFTNRNDIVFTGIETLPSSDIVVSVADAAASERGPTEAPDTGTIVLTRTGALSQALAVNYTLSGTAVNGRDFEALGSVIFFAAGSDTATVVVTPRNNSSADGTRGAVVSFLGGAGFTFGAASTGVISIADNDQPRIGLVVSTGPGPASDIRILSGNPPALISTTAPFIGFNGGVVVARGDVNGDGIADNAAAVAAGAAPHVKVFDGVTGAEIFSLFAFDTGYLGGVTLAIGDLDGDGDCEVIVGAAVGAPHVKAFDASGTEILSFFAYTDDAGTPAPVGVSVAAGDIDGDKIDEIVTGARSASPHVKVFDRAGNAIRSFFAYDRPESFGGITIAVGDLNGDGRAEIAAATTFGVSSRLSVMDANGEITNTLTLPPASGVGPSIAIGDIDRNGSRELIVGIGPKVSVFDGGRFGLLFETFPYEGFAGGVFVGA